MLAVDFGRPDVAVEWKIVEGGEGAEADEGETGCTG